MDASDLSEMPAFFTVDGKDIWELQSCFKSPSCTLKNLKTGEIQEFGVNGLTARSFHRIKMPIKTKGE